MHGALLYCVSKQLIFAGVFGLALIPRAALAQEDAAQIEVSANAEDDSESAEDSKTKEPEIKRARLTIGARFDPDDNFIATAHATTGNFLRSNHTYSLGALVSGRRQSLRFAHDAPGLLGSGLDYHSEIVHKHIAYRAFQTTSTGAAIRLTGALGPHLSASVGLRAEQLDSLRLNSAGQGPLHLPASESGELVAIEVGLRYDGRSDSNMGSTASLLLSQADTRFGSDYQLTKLSAFVSHRAPLVGPLTLNLRGHGQRVMGRDGNAIPLGARLQWGGHSDVRGYGLDSTGPEFGGGLKAGGTAEVRFPLLSALHLDGVLFYDVGLLSKSASIGSTTLYSEVSTLRQSVGAGLRWNSPIGPIGLDFALPLFDKSAGPALLLSVGGTF